MSRLWIITFACLAAAGLDAYLVGFHDHLNHLQRLYSPIFLPTLLKAGQWQKLLVSNFHHLNSYHLIVNSVLFAILGIVVERKVGGVKMGYLILSSAVTSDLVSLFSARQGGTLGMSALLYAVGGAFLSLFLRGFWVRWKPVRIVLPLFLGATLIGLEWHTKGGALTTNHLSHYSGLAIGLLFGAAVSRKPKQWSLRHTTVISLPFLLLGLVWWQYSQRPPLPELQGEQTELVKNLEIKLPPGMEKHPEQRLWYGVCVLKVALQPPPGEVKPDLSKIPNVAPMNLNERDWVYSAHSRHLAFATVLEEQILVMKFSRSGAPLEEDLSWARRWLATLAEK